ncbi:MAG: serine hydrolase domain-containing protein [Mycobacteriales bacterium]
MTGDFALADAVRRCDRLAALAQRDDRHPGLVAAVVRPDRPLWTAAVGADVTADHQFRIGSITKTFTAVLVMQLRDAGQLELRDPLSAHLEVPAHGTLTLRDLLGHTAGLQREPHGDVWDTLRMPDTGQLVAELELAEAISRPGRRWHYSNLAFALLGEVVATRYGAPWAEVLADRVLQPLGMTRTTVAPVPPAAQGYLVEPYTDRAHPEGPVDLRGFAPAGQLWSTVGDLATWADFLASGHPEVLAASTLEEMSEPVAVVERDVFTDAWGLGLQLTHRGGRAVHAGHGGAMPGFLASLQVRRADRIGAVALGNNGVGEGIFDLTHHLIEASLDADPAAGGAVADRRAGPAGVHQRARHLVGRGPALRLPLEGRRAARPAGERPGRPALVSLCRGAGQPGRAAHGVRPGGRRAAAAAPRPGRDGHRDALGDVQVHQDAADHRLTARCQGAVAVHEAACGRPSGGAGGQAQVRHVPTRADRRG